MSALPSQAILPLEPSGQANVWVERLSLAFDDVSRHSGFLALAESAVAACPGDPIILTLAATAALLDERPERVLVFLKRISKRYSATPTDHLLQALALFQMRKRVAARSLLERHGLIDWHNALQVFPGGKERMRWMLEQLDAIMDQGEPSRPARRAAAKKMKVKPAPIPRMTTPPVAEAALALPQPLPRIEIDISFAAEMDLAPLLRVRFETHIDRARRRTRIMTEAA